MSRHGKIPQRLTLWPRWQCAETRRTSDRAWVSRHEDRLSDAGYPIKLLLLRRGTCLAIPGPWGLAVVIRVGSRRLVHASEPSNWSGPESVA